MIHYRDEHLGRLLRSTYRHFNTRMMQKLQEVGYEDLTQFQAEILSYIELDGTRIKSLTLKLGITKQAVGEVVSQLVAAGYIKKTVSPQDKRVQLLRFAKKGEQFLFDEHRLKAEIELEYMSILGRKEFENLQKALQIIVHTRN